MKACLLAALLVASLGAHRVAAVEIAASGLSIPFFDEAGKLTHKVLAKRGAMAGPVQKLQEVEVEYYAAGNPDHVVQRVIASDAEWNEKTEILEGDGAIRVITEENHLAGEGFRLEVARSQLNVQRNFRLTNSEVALTSDRAVVDLVLERRDERVKLRDVRRCEAIGNLHVKVLPTAKKTYNFDEAFSERAVYDGATHTITVPTATKLHKKGKAPGTTNHFEIKLDPATRPGAKLR